MNDVDQTFVEFQAVQQARHCAENWLATFETALTARDARRIGDLFHPDSHLHDILAFTWHLTPVAGRTTSRQRLAAQQGRTGARAFHLL